MAMLITMETDVTIRLGSPILSLFHTHTESLRQRVYLKLYYHYIPFLGKKSSSRLSIDTSEATYIQCRRSLLHFSPSTSRPTISATTHLRNLYISKKIPSQCRYQTSNVPVLIPDHLCLIGLTLPHGNNETLAGGTKGSPRLGPERPRVYSNLSPKEKDRHIARHCTQPKHPQNSNYFKDKMLLMQAQVNVVALDEEQLLLLVDYYDAFDYDVNEAPMAQTMFMANLSFADPVYDEADSSYDSDILFEVHDHDHYQDAVCEHHEEHKMHDNVQPNHVVDSHTNYTCDSNMIPYDQYVKDNAVPGVQSNVSSIPNDAYMMIYNDIYEPHAQSVSKTSRNTVVDNSLTIKLATYKEQVELYKRQNRFELTEREPKIDEQLRIVITDRNFKEENLKKELYSVKLKLASTINHNKSMVEEVTSLKKDFKQKENHYLEEFLDMKSLKEKVEDRLYKQDQSL
nr:hypothetical protein [Tanacetum cinerariifolium]